VLHFAGQSQLTDKGACAFIKVTMMLAVVILHCRLQITACDVSFGYYSVGQFLHVTAYML